MTQQNLKMLGFLQTPWTDSELDKTAEEGKYPKVQTGAGEKPKLQTRNSGSDSVRSYKSAEKWTHTFLCFPAQILVASARQWGRRESSIGSLQSTSCTAPQPGCYQLPGKESRCRNSHDEIKMRTLSQVKAAQCDFVSIALPLLGASMKAHLCTVKSIIP